MEFFGGLLALLGGIVFPLIFIIGMVKPSLFKKPDKTPANRKQIAMFAIPASLLCLGVGGAMLPAVEQKDVTAKTTVVNDNEPSTAKVEKTDKVEAVDTTAIKSAEPVKVESPDLGLSVDQFVKNYNAVIMKADKNWIINSIEDDQTIKFAPMPKNASMSGGMADNGNLRGIVVGVAGSEDPVENLKVMAVCLAAANAVQGGEAKEEISKVVTDILPEAIKNEGESQSRTVGKVKYAAIFSKSLGGVFFTIDPAD